MLNGKPTYKFLILYTLAFIGASAALLGPISVSLALKVGQIDSITKTASLGIVLGVGAFAALIINPIFGRLSDSCTSKYGKRKPYIIIGTLVATIVSLFLPNSNSISSLAIVWLLVQVAYNAVYAALNAILADQVDEKYRGTTSGMIAIGGAVGILAGVLIAGLFADNNFLMFNIPAIGGGILVLLFGCTFKDIVLEKDKKIRFSLKSVLESFKFNPIKESDFTKIFLSRFALLCAFFTISNYQIYFLQDKLGYSSNDAASTVMISYGLAIFGAVLGSAISGSLSDKLGKRKIFITLSGLALFVASTTLAICPTLIALYISATILGIGQGVINTVSLVATTETLPEKNNAGKYLGIINISATLPQSVAPAIAPFFLKLGGVGDNYFALFISAAIFALIGTGIFGMIKKVK